jgi:hypothetical protein
VSISWIEGHNGNTGNDCADPLAGALRRIYHKGLLIRTRYQLEAATLELHDRGKQTIILPPPKKSAMDKTRNKEARISSQLRTNHWFSGVYLKRIGKRAHAGS